MMAAEGNAATPPHPPTPVPVASTASALGEPTPERPFPAPFLSREAVPVPIVREPDADARRPAVGDATAEPVTSLDPRAVTRVLLLAMLALTAANVLALYLHHGLGYDHALGFVPLFDFNMESNAPTWFSSALLLGVGIVAALVGRRAPTMRGYWYAVAGVAVFLSLDESAQLHELVTVALRRGLAVGPGFSMAVVAIVSLVPVLLGAAVFYRFVRALPRPTAVGLLVAGAVYLTGAVGIDTIASALAFAGVGGGFDLVLNTVEELFEMTGLILAIRVLLAHLGRHADRAVPTRPARPAHGAA